MKEEIRAFQKLVNVCRNCSKILQAMHVTKESFL